MADPEFTYWALWIQPMVPVMFQAFLSGATEEQVREAAEKTFCVGVDLVNESNRRSYTDRRHSEVWSYVDPPPPEPQSDADREGGRNPPTKPSY